MNISIYKHRNYNMYRYVDIEIYQYNTYKYRTIYGLMGEQKVLPSFAPRSKPSAESSHQVSNQGRAFARALLIREIVDRPTAAAALGYTSTLQTNALETAAKKNRIYNITISCRFATNS